MAACYTWGSKPKCNLEARLVCRVRINKETLITRHQPSHGIRTCIHTYMYGDEGDWMCNCGTTGESIWQHSACYCQWSAHLADCSFAKRNTTLLPLVGSLALRKQSDVSEPASVCLNIRLYIAKIYKYTAVTDVHFSLHIYSKVATVN